MKKIIILTILFSNLSFLSFAQTLNGGEQQIILETGMTPELLPITIGYERGFTLHEERAYLNHLQLEGKMTIRPITQSFNDINFDIGAETVLYSLKDWKASASLNGGLKFTDNNLFSGTALSTDFGLNVGYYSQPKGKLRGFIALKFLYSQTWATYLKTKDVYKDYWYDAQDGWYKTPSSIFTMGLNGGLDFAKGFGFILGAGYKIFQQNSIYTPPVDISLGLHYKF